MFVEDSDVSVTSKHTVPGLLEAFKLLLSSFCFPAI